jgi:Flp pilus assembly protein TadD
MRHLQGVLLWASMTIAASSARGESARKVSLRLEAGEREPGAGRARLDAKELEKLRAAVQAAPRDRAARFALVKALVDVGQPREALAQARAWRARDAYNLVVVRLIGDILSELGERAAARRTYSAVVELQAQDPEAHRALATVLRQGGDLAGAHQRLSEAARLRPADKRIAFELADTAQRLERLGEAAERFRAIVADAETAEEIRYPSKQRLAQIYSAQRHATLRRGDGAEAARLARAIAALEVKGGAVNDIKIYLSWDTDRTDVDLWVTNPAGERISYQRKRGSCGGELFHDVTTGYGPESFTAHVARRGSYRVQVNFFDSSRRTFTEARGEVAVVLHEGTEREQRHVLPYRLFQPKQTATVAKIFVERAK